MGFVCLCLQGWRGHIAWMWVSLLNDIDVSCICASGCIHSWVA